LRLNALNFIGFVRVRYIMDLCMFAVTLKRDKLFDDFETPEYYPLEKIKVN